jgi:hypothetical protein
LRASAQLSECSIDSEPGDMCGENEFWETRRKESIIVNRPHVIHTMLAGEKST